MVGVRRKMRTVSGVGIGRDGGRDFCSGYFCISRRNAFSASARSSCGIWEWMTPKGWSACFQSGRFAYSGSRPEVQTNPSADGQKPS
jgi:hypothetical protein